MRLWDVAYVKGHDTFYLQQWNLHNNSSGIRFTRGCWGHDVHKWHNYVRSTADSIMNEDRAKLNGPAVQTSEAHCYLRSLHSFMLFHVQLRSQLIAVGSKSPRRCSGGHHAFQCSFIYIPNQIGWLASRGPGLVLGLENERVAYPRTVLKSIFKHAPGKSMNDMTINKI